MRVHALRHDRRMLVEEWHSFTILPKKRPLLHQFVLPDQTSARLAPLPALAIALTGYVKHSEVGDHLKKRRKIQRSFTVTASVYQRAIFVLAKRALRRWLQFAESREELKFAIG